MSTLVRDNLSNAAQGYNSINSTTHSFSFTSDANATDVITDIKLQISDGIADGGAVTVALYKAVAGTNAVGALVGTLAVIPDSSLGTTTTSVLDISSPNLYVLTASTRYYITVTGNSNSFAGLFYTPSTTGTGIAGEYYDGGTPNSTGGTYLAQVTENACYVAGTRIATEHGETKVEDLAIGTLVRTASGALRPVKWIGHRDYTRRVVLRSPALQPIRFRAGSLGNGLPRRDLLVSPTHAMLLDGHLVSAELLVDNVHIIRDATYGAVQYFHVELASHDVLLAEGASSESYLDDDNRRIFFNHAEFDELDGQPAGPGRPCAPRIEGGPALEAIRIRLAQPSPVSALAA